LLYDLLFIFLFILSIPTGTSAQTGRSLLATSWPGDKLKTVLLGRSDWHPYPTAAERESWNALPDDLRKALVERGEKFLNCPWPELPATLFLEYKRIGNRSHYERQRNLRRNALEGLVIAECVEGKGRFLDDITNGIWTTCEETYWGVPAHIGVQKAGSGLPDAAEPTVDLFAGETASLLAWTVYLLGPQLDQVSPLVVPRIHLEMKRRIFDPCLERDDFWWMGFHSDHVNNWTPWICSNWLASVLLLESDPGRRLAAIEKITKSLDIFLDSYPPDGGCDEGPGYWGRAGASLFDCLELLLGATSGKVDLYSDPLIREIGRYIYRVQVCGDYFINFADASAKAGADGDLAYRYGKRIEDPLLQTFGAFEAKQDGEPGGSVLRQLPAIFNYTELKAAPAAQPLLRDVWLKGIGVMAARSLQGSCQGLYLAGKAGHNAESHNHNDVGNFLVYLDGNPAVIDAGVETYTAKTFSSKRYEIWTMQSAYHNCPTVNGMMQGAGREYEAKNVTYETNATGAGMKMDIAPAYPKEANLKSWIRTLRLNRGKDILIQDDYTLTAPAKDITLTLMTSCSVSIPRPGEILLSVNPTGSGKPSRLKITYDAKKLKAATEDIPVEDGRLKNVWGERITRILLKTESPPLHDSWTVRIQPSP